MGDAVWIGRREHDRVRRSGRVAEDRGALAAEVVEHRAQVVCLFGERRHPIEWIRQADAAPVEDDQP